MMENATLYIRQIYKKSNVKTDKLEDRKTDRHSEGHIRTSDGQNT